MPPLEVSRKSNRKRTTGTSLSGANLERVGDHNQRVILQAIRVGAPITRVALPDDLGRVDLPHRPPGYDVWSSADVSKLLADILPLPVFLENDAAAAALGELQFGHGLRKPSFFYVLISSGLGGGLVVEGDYFRGAQGRSGEIGFLPVRSPQTQARSLQEVVSLSALYAHLEAGGVAVSRPDQLTALSPQGQALVEGWIALSAELLVQPFVAISCVVNPEAIYVGGRLPDDLIDRLVAAVNARLAKIEDVPALARVERAATSADGPAVGAALLPFMAQLLPSRAALMKTGQG